MTSEPRPLVRCVVCEHDGASPDPYFYSWRQRSYWIHRCARCTHQFVHPAVTPADQLLIYDDHYFSTDGDWACGIFRSGYAGAESQLRAEAREILSMLPAPPGALLDIGCAGGTFLTEARTLGYDVAGIELNPSMAEYARDTYQLDVVTSRIEDVPSEQWRAAFDVVTLLDVLEHLPQPLAAMKNIARWVRPSGVILVRGPLSNSRIGHLKEGVRRFGRLTKQLPGYPLDANMFNKRSMTCLFAGSGFEIVAWIGETPSFSNVLGRRMDQASDVIA